MNPTKGFFITGTDTGVGKTLVSLGLCLSLKADYWKPIQSGEPTDSDFISPFLTDNQVHPSSYFFKHPLSPNQAAKKENQKINLKNIILPQSSRLIVEGVGGAFVPLNDQISQLDLMEKLQLPLIVVARSGLGTLNHSLSTLQILKSRNVQIKGLILSGSPNSLNKEDLKKWSGVPILLEIPPLPEITKSEILRTFKNLSL